MRTFDEEMTRRREQRRKYFENPKYRKWSDIVDKCQDEASTENDYENFCDDYLFSSYITNGPISNGPLDYNHSNIVLHLLDTGHTLPIDWSSFYAYFDERLNDPENPFRYEFEHRCEGTGIFTNSKKLKDLLDEYREKLLTPPYDII